jgi:hypothetical protein
MQARAALPMLGVGWQSPAADFKSSARLSEFAAPKSSIAFLWPIGHRIEEYSLPLGGARLGNQPDYYFSLMCIRITHPSVAAVTAQKRIPRGS